MPRLLHLAPLLALVLGLVFATPAGASRLVTIDAPSRAGFVDVRTALFPAARPVPARLRADVLLPDGYDARKAYPLLYLLHGAGDGYAAWANPAQGDVRRTLKGLPAIVVMPEGGLGFYSDWYNRGRRRDPAWTRYHLEEVLPLIQRRFRIRPGRRWHAIAGLSMGGYGTSFLATQLPGYFGTAVPMSGLGSIRRPEIVAGLSAIGGVKYPALWGPSDGAYARGHDPVALARNLRFTRVILRTGNGTPRRGVVSPVPQLSGALEGVLRIGNDQFAAALRRGRGQARVPRPRRRARLALLARRHRGGGAQRRAVPPRRPGPVALELPDRRALGRRLGAALPLHGAADRRGDLHSLRRPADRERRRPRADRRRPGLRVRGDAALLAAPARRALLARAP